jgi:hypothetical protein
VVVTVLTSSDVVQLFEAERENKVSSIVATKRYESLADLISIFGFFRVL